MQAIPASAWKRLAEWSALAFDRGPLVFDFTLDPGRASQIYRVWTERVMTGRWADAVAATPARPPAVGGASLNSAVARWPACSGAPSGPSGATRSTRLRECHTAVVPSAEVGANLPGAINRALKLAGKPGLFLPTAPTDGSPATAAAALASENAQLRDALAAYQRRAAASRAVTLEIGGNVDPARAAEAVARQRGVELAEVGVAGVSQGGERGSTGAGERDLGHARPISGTGVTSGRPAR